MYEHVMNEFKLYVNKEAHILSIIKRLIEDFNVKSVKSTPFRYSKLYMGEAVGTEECSEIKFICEPIYAPSIIDYLEGLKGESLSGPVLEYTCVNCRIVTKENYFVSEMSKLLNDNAELRIYDNNKAVVCKNMFPTDFTGDYSNVNELIQRWNNRNNLQETNKDD